MLSRERPLLYRSACAKIIRPVLNIHSIAHDHVDDDDDDDEDDEDDEDDDDGPTSRDLAKVPRSIRMR